MHLLKYISANAELFEDIYEYQNICWYCKQFVLWIDLKTWVATLFIVYLFCIWYYTVTYDGVFHILLVSIFNNHTFPLIKSQCVEVPSFLLSLMYLENVQKSLVKWGIREEKIEIWQWQLIPLSDSELTALGQSCPELSHKW